MRCEFSGTTGSSRKNGRYGSSSGATRRALARREAPVEVDGDVAVVARDLAGGGDPGDHAVELGDRGDRAHPAAGVHLHRGEPGLQLGADRGRATSLGSSPPTQPYIRIRSRTWTAEELVHGGAEVLAGDVPEGLVQARTALARMGPPR